ncbi:MAG: pyridoxal-phosphate dependent enzyme, partial [Opitutales bacterium]
AAERGWHAMPSFHPDLVRGLAVSTLHFLRSTPPLDTVYIPIGLGSGLCALLAARAALGLRTEVIGVCSDRADAIARSFAAGRVVTSPATTRIADGLACSTPDADALEHIRHGAARIVAVSDEVVESALRVYFSDTHNVAEGAAGAGLAAVLQERTRNAGRRIGVVLTGGNIDREVFARVLAAGGGEK